MLFGAGVGGRKPNMYIVVISKFVFVSGFEFHFDGFSTKCERRNAVDFESDDLSIDAVDGESEDDDADEIIPPPPPSTTTTANWFVVYLNIETFRHLDTGTLGH